MSHLYGLESVEAIFRIERDRVLEKRFGLTEVPDGDGDGDGIGQTVGLQVDVLLAVGPQQVRSQDGEPAGRRDGRQGRDTLLLEPANVFGVTTNSAFAAALSSMVLQLLSLVALPQRMLLLLLQLLSTAQSCLLPRLRLPLALLRTFCDIIFGVRSKKDVRREF